MPGVTVKHLVKADPDTTFRVFADIPNAESTVAGIDSIEMLSDGPVGIGTRWRETRTMMGKAATEEMWVTGFDPPRSYTVEAESHGTHYHSRYEFEAAEGGTRVTLRFEGRPQSIATKLMTVVGYLFMGQIRKMLAQDMADAAAHAEGLVGGKTVAGTDASLPA